MAIAELDEWIRPPKGGARGYIQPESLKELWFHTGTICNLSCPFCLEGSQPGDNRLQQITFVDAKPFIDEVVDMGVEQFSFTGGEPFIIRDIFKILDYALDMRPCMVLTNGTDPILKRIDHLKPLLKKPHALNFRISLDSPIAEIHDAGRGKGNFAKALSALQTLHTLGFKVSIARHSTPKEDTNAVDKIYRELLGGLGLTDEITIVAFPEFHLPSSMVDVPFVTENCMTTYQTEKTRAEFMCNFSKMVVKKEGAMRVYACTLVDDDTDYDCGGTLSESMQVRVMLKHHRCYSCFAYGASCSER